MLSYFVVNFNNRQTCTSPVYNNSTGVIIKRSCLSPGVSDVTGLLISLHSPVTDELVSEEDLQ